jgi:BMFP domain-containing protein YqiC
VPILNTLSHILGRPAGRLLESSVRDSIAQAIKEQDLASRSEVDTLRHALKNAEGEAKALSARLVALESRTDSLLAQLAEARTDAEKSRESLGQAKTELVSARHQIDEALANSKIALAEASKVASSPEQMVSSPPPGCRVPGCTGEHRSRGFCSPHYQQWRRGTLRGFVTGDGHVVDGGRRWKVDSNLAGLPYSLVGEATATVVRVQGRVVPSRVI